MPRRKAVPRSHMQDVLLTVMEDRLYAEGHDRDKLAAHMTARGGTDASLSRLVNGHAKAPRYGIDAIVDAYAAVIGCTPLDLWAEALARYQASPNVDAWIEGWRDQHRDTLRHRTAQMGRDAKALKQASREAKPTRRTAQRKKK